MIAGLIAFTFQVLVVKHFAVSVPFWDEWDALVGFIVNQRAGLIHWDDMFAQHMEHRILTARVGYIFVDRLFDEVNLSALMMVSALLMGAISGLWAYALQRLRQPAWLIAASLIVLLSLAQYENMIWGFQIQFYLLMLPMLAAIVGVALTPRLTWTVLVLVTVAAVACTLSLASGLLVWPVLGSILLLRMWLDAPAARDALASRMNWAQLAVFAAVGAASFWIYLDGYQAIHPPAMGPVTTFSMLKWAGHAFSFPLVDPTKPEQSPWLPPVLVAECVPIVVALAMYVRRKQSQKLILLVGLLLMVLVNVAVMTWGRSSAVWVASRYGTICLWGSVVSLVALADLIQAARERRSLAGVALLAAIVIGLLGGHLWRSRAYVPEIRGVQAARLQYRATVQRYLREPKNARELPDFVPFPKDRLKVFLDRPLFVRELPWDLRPTGKPSTPTKVVSWFIARAEIWFGLSLALAAAYAGARVMRQ